MFRMTSANTGQTLVTPHCCCCTGAKIFVNKALWWHNVPLIYCGQYFAIPDYYLLQLAKGEVCFIGFSRIQYPDKHLLSFMTSFRIWRPPHLLQGPHRQLLGYKSMNSLVIIQSVEWSEVYSLISVWEVGVTSFYCRWSAISGADGWWRTVKFEFLQPWRRLWPDRTCKPRRLVMFRGHVFEECRGLIAEAEAF